MKLGTKSLLWGTHQFLWHPLTVGLAWRRLYGRWPSWQMWVCILVHDWGYWGCPNMDGPEGRRHPFRGGDFAGRIVYRIHKLLGATNNTANMNAFHASREVDRHSRSLCADLEETPSDLCWADKACIFYDPEWLYILRARLSGEMNEWRDNAVKSGHVSLDMSDSVWFRWYRRRVGELLDQELPGWR